MRSFVRLNTLYSSAAAQELKVNRSRVDIATGIILALFVASRGITTPIARLRERMVSLAAGETTAEIDGMARKDEVGQMAQAVQVFR